MPVFLPPKRASKTARAAYLVTYLRKMADNNDKLAAGYRDRDSDYDNYHTGRAQAFREAADCLAQLEI